MEAPEAAAEATQQRLSAADGCGEGERVAREEDRGTAHVADDRGAAAAGDTPPPIGELQRQAASAPDERHQWDREGGDILRHAASMPADTNKESDLHSFLHDLSEFEPEPMPLLTTGIPNLSPRDDDHNTQSDPAAKAAAAAAKEPAPLLGSLLLRSKSMPVQHAPQPSETASMFLPRTDGMNARGALPSFLESADAARDSWLLQDEDLLNCFSPTMRSYSMPIDLLGAFDAPFYHQGTYPPADHHQLHHPRPPPPPPGSPPRDALAKPPRNRKRRRSATRSAAAAAPPPPPPRPPPQLQRQTFAAMHAGAIQSQNAIGELFLDLDSRTPMRSWHMSSSAAEEASHRAPRPEELRRRGIPTAAAAALPATPDAATAPAAGGLEATAQRKAGGVTAGRFDAALAAARAAAVSATPRGHANPMVLAAAHVAADTSNTVVAGGGQTARARQKATTTTTSQFLQNFGLGGVTPTASPGPAPSTAVAEPSPSPLPKEEAEDRQPQEELRPKVGAAPLIAKPHRPTEMLRGVTREAWSVHFNAFVDVPHDFLPALPVLPNATEGGTAASESALAGEGSAPRRPSPGQRLHLGLFDSPEAAARAHDVALLKLRDGGGAESGGDGELNYPQSDYAGMENLRDVPVSNFLNALKQESIFGLETPPATIPPSAAHFGASLFGDGSGSGTAAPHHPDGDCS